MASELAVQVDRALRTVGIAADSILIGDPNDKTTWKVTPAALQAGAQVVIDAFNPLNPSTVDADTAAQAVATASQKDLLATLALIASQTDVNWGTKTLAQKKAAVQALANSWQTLRAFVEKNL